MKKWKFSLSLLFSSAIFASQGGFVEKAVVQEGESYPMQFNYPSGAVRLILVVVTLICFYVISYLIFSARLDKCIEKNILPTKSALRCFSLIPIALIISVILYFGVSTIPPGIVVSYPLGMLSYVFNNFILVFVCVVLLSIALIMFLTGK